MRKKLLFIPLVLFFCCGWTTDYTLKLENEKFDEKVLFEFDENIEELAKSYSKFEDGDFFEPTLVYDDIYSIENNKKYVKNIRTEENHSVVTLTSTYSYDEFSSIKYIQKCFDNFEIDNNKKTFSVKITGNFNCQGFGIKQFKLKTNNKLDVNSKIKESGSYVWNITDTNNNIEFNIYKNIIMYEVIVYSILAILFIIISFIVIKKLKEVNKI